MGARIENPVIAIVASDPKIRQSSLRDTVFLIFGMQHELQEEYKKPTAKTAKSAKESIGSSSPHNTLHSHTARSHTNIPIYHTVPGTIPDRHAYVSRSVCAWQTTPQSNCMEFLAVAAHLSHALLIQAHQAPSTRSIHHVALHSASTQLNCTIMPSR